MPQTIDVNGAQLAHLLELAKAGDEIILAEGQTPVARLTAIAPANGDQTPAPKPRIAGLHRGMIQMSDDFDEPLPDEFWLGEE